MKKATAGQRFVAWLVDSIIISIVVSLISTLIFLICSIKAPKAINLPGDKVRNVVAEEISDSLGPLYDVDTLLALDKDTFVMLSSLINYENIDNSLMSNLTSDEMNELRQYIADAKVWYEDYQSYNIKRSVTTIIVFLIILVAYYDILGYYWSKQTVGRLLMKIKVTDSSGKKPQIGTLILRDLVGYGLISFLNVCCCIPLIINIVLICGKDHLSIGDKLSYTQMIVDGSEEPIKEEKNGFYDSNNIGNEFKDNASESGNVFDAEVVEDDKKDEE